MIIFCLMSSIGKGEKATLLDMWFEFLSHMFSDTIMLQSKLEISNQLIEICFFSVDPEFAEFETIQLVETWWFWKRTSIHSCWFHNNEHKSVLAIMHVFRHHVMVREQGVFEFRTFRSFWTLFEMFITLRVCFSL